MTLEVLHYSENCLRNCARDRDNDINVIFQKTDKIKLSSRKSGEKCDRALSKKQNGSITRAFLVQTRMLWAPGMTTLTCKQYFYAQQF